MTASNQLVRQNTVGIHTRVGLGDHILAFFDGRQVVDFRGDLAINHFAIRRFNKAEVVDAGIQRQRVDQADVRTFRGFNRAHTAVVGRVYVTHFETGTLAGQTTRAKGRYTALVGNFRQRVRLVHKLRQLAGTEKFLDRGRNRLGIDQVMRHQVV